MGGSGVQYEHVLGPGFISILVLYMWIHPSKGCGVRGQMNFVYVDALLRSSCMRAMESRAISPVSDNGVRSKSFAKVPRSRAWIMMPARYISPGLAAFCTLSHNPIHLESALSTCLFGSEISHMLDLNPNIIRKKAFIALVPGYLRVID